MDLWTDLRTNLCIPSEKKILLLFLGTVFVGHERLPLFIEFLSKRFMLLLRNMHNGWTDRSMARKIIING